MSNEKMHSLTLKDVRISDQFWTRYTGLVPKVIIPYQWDILNDRIEGAELSHCLKNFKIAAGEEEGSFVGAVFRDSDAYKWLEAVAFSLETNPDNDLERLADEVIDLIARAQQDDGYINTYYQINKTEKRWTNLMEGHELYTAGHLIEAAVTYHDATAKDSLLTVACRFADLICRVFGRKEGQIHGYPGHQEIELALVKLYRKTGAKRYLDAARYFIDERGQVPNYFLGEIQKGKKEYIHDEFKDYDLKYAQSHVPPREQRTAEGHAVRATYMYAAMADLAYEYGDAELMAACEAIWDNIIQKRMYITGSVGSSGFLERFTTDYDLPNGSNYSETCASIGLVLFSSRMAAIKQDASYMDVVERALYNTVLAGLSLAGDRYFYVNPLEVWPESCMEHTSKAHVKPVRQRWFSVPCCPTNVARTLASLGQYIYFRDDDLFLLNLYIDNKTEYLINGCHVSFALRSSHLTDGKSVLTVNAKQPGTFTVGLRIPGYVQAYAITIDGEPIDPPVEKGYALIERQWDGEARIGIDFTIPPQFVAAHPDVRADAGKVALTKGPIVYCLEEADNGANLASIIVDPRASIVADYDPDLFDGTPVLRYAGKKISKQNWNSALYQPADFITEPVELKAIPYCLWGNRTPGEMTVWMRASV